MTRLKFFLYYVVPVGVAVALGAVLYGHATTESAPSARADRAVDSVPTRCDERLRTYHLKDGQEQEVARSICIVRVWTEKGRVEHLSSSRGVLLVSSATGGQNGQSKPGITRYLLAKEESTVHVVLCPNGTKWDGKRMEC